jgi:hypothetical protein
MSSAQNRGAVHWGVTHLHKYEKEGEEEELQNVLVVVGQ